MDDIASTYLSRHDGERSSSDDAAAVQSLRRLLAIEETVRKASESTTNWWVRLRANSETAVTKVALDELLVDVLAATRDLLDADFVAVLVANEAGDELVARGSLGFPHDATGEVHIPAGTGMAGRVLATRRPMVVGDLSTIDGVAEVLVQSGARSLVAVPMRGSDGAMLGVLHADSVQLHRYGQEDAGVLQLVADRLSTAIERVRLFEAERAARERAELLAQRLGRLQRITAALSRDLDGNELADVILTEVASDLGDGVISRTLWLKEGEVLSLFASGGTEGGAVAYAEIPLDAPLPGPLALRTRTNVWIASLAELESRFPALIENVMVVSRAWCVLPLVVGEEARGVIVLGFDEEQSFDADQRSFLSVVAYETAQALNRHWLREAQALLAARAGFLAEASASLASSLDTAATLRRVVRLMVPDVADVASLHLFDDRGVLRRVEFAHRDREVEGAAGHYDDEHDYEALSALAAVTAAAGKALLFPVFARDAVPEIAIEDRHSAILHKLDVGSAIAVPVVVRGETLGLLGLMRLRGSAAYVQDDLHFVEELGRRAAMAIDNSAAHQRRIDVARQLQASLVPPARIEVPGLDVGAAFHPAGEGMEVGGDFYDAFALPSGRWVFMIGDVSGSGPAAAALTAQVRHSARVAARTGLGPAEVIAMVNDSLDETTSTEWFCTMVYAEFAVDPEGADLAVVCAGHPTPLILRDRTVEELGGHGPLLGVLSGATFEAVHVRLDRGQSLVLVTDGAIEARRAEGGGEQAPTFFSPERLMAVVEEQAGTTADVTTKSIADAVLEFAGGRLTDDMAVLVIRVDPAAASAPTAPASP